MFQKHNFEPLVLNTVRVAHRSKFNFPGMCSYYQTVRNSSDMRFTPSSVHSGELVQNLKGGPSILCGSLKPTFYISLRTEVRLQWKQHKSVRSGMLCMVNAVVKLERSALDLP